jgi:DNA-binding transcriptional regulator/RsmH inhibitor MraZ
VVDVGTGEAIEVWDAAAFEAAIAQEDNEFRESLESE